MSIMRLLPAVAACVALAGCETTSEPPSDALQPSFAMSGPVTESVTGSGHYTLTNPDGSTTWRTFSFNARKKSDGSVEGRFQLKAHGRAWMKGAVACFTIVGNEAWLGVVVERGSNPAFVGSLRGFWVVDNGEAENAPPDQLTRLPRLSFGGYATPEEFCAAAPFDGWPPGLRDIEAGNIQVRPAWDNAAPDPDRCPHGNCAFIRRDFGCGMFIPSELLPANALWANISGYEQNFEVLTPSDQNTLQCKFDLSRDPVFVGLTEPPWWLWGVGVLGTRFDHTVVLRDFWCYTGHHYTTETQATFTKSGKVQLTCKFHPDG